VVTENKRLQVEIANDGKKGTGAQTISRYQCFEKAVDPVKGKLRKKDNSPIKENLHWTMGRKRKFDMKEKTLQNEGKDCKEFPSLGASL